MALIQSGQLYAGNVSQLTPGLIQSRQSVSSTTSGGRTLEESIADYKRERLAEGYREVRPGVLEKVEGGKTIRLTISPDGGVQVDELTPGSVSTRTTSEYESLSAEIKKLERSLKRGTLSANAERSVTVRLNQLYEARDNLENTGMASYTVTEPVVSSSQTFRVPSDVERATNKIFESSLGGVGYQAFQQGVFISETQGKFPSFTTTKTTPGGVETIQVLQRLSPDTGQLQRKTFVSFTPVRTETQTETVSIAPLAGTSVGLSESARKSFEKIDASISAFEQRKAEFEKRQAEDAGLARVKALSQATVDFGGLAPGLSQTTGGRFATGFLEAGYGAVPQTIYLGGRVAQAGEALFISGRKAVTGTYYGLKGDKQAFKQAVGSAGSDIAGKEQLSRTGESLRQTFTTPEGLGGVTFAVGVAGLGATSRIVKIREQRLFGDFKVVEQTGQKSVQAKVPTQRAEFQKYIETKGLKGSPKQGEYVATGKPAQLGKTESLGQAKTIRERLQFNVADDKGIGARSGTRTIRTNYQTGETIMVERFKNPSVYKGEGDIIRITKPSGSPGQYQVDVFKAGELLAGKGKPLATRTFTAERPATIGSASYQTRATRQATGKKPKDTGEFRPSEARRESVSITKFTKGQTQFKTEGEYLIKQKVQTVGRQEAKLGKQYIVEKRTILPAGESATKTTRAIPKLSRKEYLDPNKLYARDIKTESGQTIGRAVYEKKTPTKISSGEVQQKISTAIRKVSPEEQAYLRRVTEAKSRTATAETRVEIQSAKANLQALQKDAGIIRDPTLQKIITQDIARQSKVLTRAEPSAPKTVTEQLLESRGGRQALSFGRQELLQETKPSTKPVSVSVAKIQPSQVSGVTPSSAEVPVQRISPSPTPVLLLKPESKVALVEKPAFISEPISRVEYRVDSRPALLQRVQPLREVRERVEFLPLRESETRVETKPIFETRQSRIQETRPITSTRIVSEIVTTPGKTPPPFAPSFIPPSTPTRTPTPRPFVKPKIELPSKGEQFIARVKSRGVFKSAGVFGRFGEAFQAGKARTEGTASASFEVVSTRTGRKVVPAGGLPASFTYSKRSPGTFVQRRGFRISSAGEKAEITRKGLAVLRQSRTFKSRGVFA